MTKKLANGVLLIIVLVALMGGGRMVQQSRTEAWQASATAAVAAQPDSGASRATGSTVNWSVNTTGTTQNSAPQTSHICKHHQSGRPLL
ncbi:MAG TPA: hypothetical protein VLQ48_14420 [Chloroflexia bacterium]|nr:hypothetical protein [Chloroflexia bacterium]